MGKNIILCSDGTGNTAIKNRGTNVFKLFEAIDLDPERGQRVFYDDGVGTESLKLLKIMGGAFGFGLSRNVRELYANLVRVYQPGDRIFLFGFSRGAFTVRTLAGFICHCGILDMNALDTNGGYLCRNDTELMKKVRGGYYAYRHKYRTIASHIWRALFKSATRRKYGFTEVEEFRQYTHQKPQDAKLIHFIGVWDTVAAMGFPVIGVSDFFNHIYKFKFPDNVLSEDVATACQALSIDDKRATFWPEMWDESQEKSGKERRIHQVWFAGVHANVGGGYPKQGMSLVTLDWMMEMASRSDLFFIDGAHDQVREHANVNDKLYNSRSGLAVYYRYKPRDIHALCNDRKKKIHIETPLIHESALYRSLDVTDGYAPGNLPKGCRFVATRHDGYVHEDESRSFDQANGAESSLLKRKAVAPWIRLRQVLQWIFMILSLILVCRMVKHNGFGTIMDAFSKQNLVAIAKALIASSPIWLLILTVVVVKLSRIARNKLQNQFSGFWYALKRQVLQETEE